VKAAVSLSSPCLCGSSKPYSACCAPLHDGAIAESPEALMRSRYVAYALQLDDYITRTWHASTRPANVHSEDGVKWLGLTVLRAGTTSDTEGFVEFVARYRAGGGRAERLEELSRFVREDGRWVYVAGAFPQ
jgi:SEC-C motif domain protein